MLLAVV